MTDELAPFGTGVVTLTRLRAHYSLPKTVTPGVLASLASRYAELRQIGMRGGDPAYDARDIARFFSRFGAREIVIDAAEGAAAPRTESEAGARAASEWAKKRAAKLAAPPTWKDS